MNWRIEEREAFEVFGIERIYRNNEQGKVPQFWTDIEASGECVKLVGAAGGVVESGKMRLFAVCGYFEPGENTFPYMICAEKTPDCGTDGYKTARIPKTAWAVFKSDILDRWGVEIPALFNRAYSEWLPSSGYDRAIGPDMELYYKTADGEFYEEVWIPVVKKMNLDAAQ
jgi:AraC family transcriptional regulator